MTLELKKDKNQAVEEFKRPLDPQFLIKRKKAKVLNEEDYVEAVETIIEKDFFPELTKYRARNEYIDAKDRGDVETIQRLNEQYSLGKETPSTFETPIRRKDDESECGGDETEKQKPKTEEEIRKQKFQDVTLDSFLAEHTGEDNESFNELMEESRKKFVLNNEWMFKSDEQKSILDKRKQLNLPSIEDQASSKKRSTQALDGWTYKNVNSMFYNPEGFALSKEQEIERAKKEKVINITNTRFETNPWKSDLAPDLKKHDSTSAGKVGIDGKELKRPETPNVNGYKFIRMTSPAISVTDSPFMTWGEVDSTPYRLEGSETPFPIGATGGKAFTMQEVPKRDQILLELAEKNSKFYRDKKTKALATARGNIRTPKAGSLTDRVATMSPAAQRLATTKLGIRLGTDKTLRASYTPSPSSARSSKTPSLKTPTLKTPSSLKTAISGSIRSKIPKTPSRTASLTDGLLNISSNEDNSLTDDLLNISKNDKNGGKKMRAADFF